MIRLRCVGGYRSGGLGLHYLAGEEVVVAPGLAEWLMRDSPGTFAVVEAEAVSLAALDGPPADKMLRRERAARKDRGGGEAMTRGNTPGLTRG